MPQRSNIVGDLGTTKVASDSYDIDNIYLTEEGWVYRHYKKTDKSKWWDEIIVAGQVDESTNEPCAETNPPKLGTLQSPVFESGDTFNDFEYSTQTATGGGVPTLDNTPAPPDTQVTIGTASLDNTTTTATEADVVTYVASYDGNAPSDQVSFNWIIVNATVTGGSITSDTVTVTFDQVATAGVQCSVEGADSAVTDGPTAVTLNVVVTATPATIGAVSLDNTTTTATESDVVTYVVSYDGDVPTDRVSFNWIIANASVTGGSITSDTVTVTFDQVETASVQCTVTGTDLQVTDGPTDVTLNVVVAPGPPPGTTIGTVSLDNTTLTATQGDVVTYVGSYDGDATTDQVRFDWIILNASVTGGSASNSNTVTVTFDQVVQAAGVQCIVTATDPAVTEVAADVKISVKVTA